MSTTDEGWESGDLLGHDFPVHLDALRTGGPEFLTRAFRAAGSMGSGDRVDAITRLESWSGGSTGRKAILSVTYAHPRPDLPEHLFVKFSRDLDDDRRDRGRWQMASEARFGLLSSLPDFPVAVPRCLFAEYRLESGSGVLITERIAFGTDGIEPCHAKARDYELDDIGAHYGALVRAIARLAGWHRAGRFPHEVMAQFAPRGSGRRPGTSDPTTPEQIRERIERYAGFAGRVPQLVPEPIRSDAFIAELTEQAPRAVEHAEAIRAARRDTAEGLVAFCHWNANIDNAWFWRDEDGHLACGLMDWGNVGQLNLATALTSCLTFAEPDFVIERLDELLDVFVAAFEEAGGGPLDRGALERHLALNVVAGGLRLPLDTVPLIEGHVPDLATVEGRFDPRIAEDEFARTQLHILTSSLVRWQALDAAGLVGWAVGRAGA
jgi:hypothetical protein